MSGNRKLGRTSSQRKAMLRGMVLENVPFSLHTYLCVPSVSFSL